MTAINRPAFFASIRASIFKGRLSQSQVAGMERLLAAWEAEYADKPDAWLAYCLATSYHETAHTMQPVAEIGRGKGKPYGKRVGSNIYYGRGDVQLTWEHNYERAGRLLGVDLVGKPDLALDPAVSARVLFRGMMEGWFTTRKLSDYGAPLDFVKARQIVNGMDDAHLIAGYAKAFMAAIQEGRRPAPHDDPLPGKVTTGKPAVQSTTIWAQIAAAISAVMTPLVGIVTDWRAVAVIGAVVVLAACLWTVRERLRKAREDGV